MNILFVCTANISRSFLAEKLFKQELARAGLDHVAVSSAGLSAMPDSAPDPKMVELLKKMDVEDTYHQARQITQEEVDWADIIFVMEKMHRDGIESMWPSAAGKTELLSRCVSRDMEADDIPDAFGRSPYHYRLALSQISLAVRNLMQSILDSPGDREADERLLQLLRGE